MIGLAPAFAWVVRECPQGRGQIGEVDGMSFDPCRKGLVRGQTSHRPRFIGKVVLSWCEVSRREPSPTIHDSRCLWDRGMVHPTAGTAERLLQCRRPADDLGDLRICEMLAPAQEEDLARSLGQ